MNELPPSETEDTIHVRFGPAPGRITDADFADGPVQANSTEYLLELPGSCRLHLQGHDRIVVDAVPGWDRNLAWTIILSVGASIAGLRRGLVPLHASAILARSGCIAFAGQSGAGKSTLAASLVHRNWPLFAEDLCLMSLDDTGVRVGRGLTQLRLCDDAAGLLGWSQPDSPIGAAPAKSFFSQTDSGPESSCLRRIYALEFAGEGVAPGIHRVEGSAAMLLITRCLRVRLPMLRVGAATRHFDNLVKISRQVEIYRFVRPRSLEQSAYWTSRLAEHFDH